MNESRTFVRIGLSGILLGTLFLLTLSIAAAAEKVRFETDWVITGKVAPFFIGVEKGFYKEQGLEVSIKRGFGSARGVKDLVSNTVDYAFVDSIAGIVGMSRGSAVKYVAMLFDKGPHLIVSLGKTNIRTPKDLKGKKLAAPVWDTGRYIVAALLTVNGMSPTLTICPRGSDEPNSLSTTVTPSTATLVASLTSCVVNERPRCSRHSRATK